MKHALCRTQYINGTSQPFIRVKTKQEKETLQFHPQLLPIGNSEPVVVEEVYGLLAISEEQHAHYAVQGKDGGPLGAHGIGDVECPESILADLKGEANHCSCPRTTERLASGTGLLL